MQNMENQRQAVKQTDLAWAAGFIDGEGCICILPLKSRTAVNQHYRLYVKVTQVDRFPLDHLASILGGHVYKNTRRRVRRDKVVMETYWDWYLLGDKAQAALESILPYLTLKAERAKLGIEYQKLVAQRRRTWATRMLTSEEVEQRMVLYRLMRVLNTPPTAAQRAAAETESEGPAAAGMRQSDLHSMEKVQSTAEMPVPVSKAN